MTSSSRNRVLVLMCDTSVEEKQIFVADLYSGNIIEDSVYLDRQAMLQWIAPLGSRIEPLAARAMDLLLCCPEAPIHSIPLFSA